LSCIYVILSRCPAARAGGEHQMPWILRVDLKPGTNTSMLAQRNASLAN
jgi:hypothetical protein